MDLKPNISPGKLLGVLDSLVDKIPDSIASILKKVALGIFIIFLLIGIYYGWQKGSSSAEPEGQKIAEDTKSLFYEDLEKAYNRKKKNIRFGDLSDEGISGQAYKKEYEYYTEKPPSAIVKEKPDFLRPEINKKPEIMDTTEDTNTQVSDPSIIPGKMTPEEESDLKEKSNQDIIKPSKKVKQPEPGRKRKLLMPGE